MTDGEAAARPLVLLVEDNSTIRDAFAVLLTESGYRVAQAGSGEEAYATAVRDSPDLVLMDLGLPDMGGLEVTRRLKSEAGTRHIPVIALTGRALESDHQACLVAGCAGYLPKPVNAQRLLETVAEFLAN